MKTEELRVLLGDVPVGVLSRTAADGVEFRLLESYKASYPRAVLGQQFIDDPDRIWKVRSRVPDWFSNLLPEGALRELVARQAAVANDREFFLLKHLGQDLPGAVRILADQSELPLANDHAIEPPTEPAEASDWHFSLAGVQLKFSAQQTGKGMTIPASGMGGDWIVKLPSVRFSGVPENELATMHWARASGIAVPETILLPIGEVRGLPHDALEFQESKAYAVKRFDRTSNGARVHIEDFAQVLGLYPEAKYRQHNYETIASVVAALTGERGLREFIRRLVFIVASGNGDAHHKNWSLIYPDGVNAELSPAYDMVSTIQYLHDDQLALNFARSKRWSDFSLGSFARLARKLDWPEEEILLMAEESVEAIVGAWTHSKSDFGYPRAAIQHLDVHMQKVPLLKGIPSNR